MFMWAVCLQADMQTLPHWTLASCCRSSPSWSSSTWRRSSLRSSSSPTCGPWCTTLPWPCTGTPVTSSCSPWTRAEGQPGQASPAPSYRNRTSAPLPTWPPPTAPSDPRASAQPSLMLGQTGVGHWWLVGNLVFIVHNLELVWWKWGLTHGVWCYYQPQTWSSF